MKELKYKTHLFKYRIKTDISEYGEVSTTYFYSNEPEVKYRKKWYIFGPTVEYLKYKFLFSLDYNIESDKFTASKVRSSLDLKLSLLKRAEEIKRGDIV